MIKLILYQNCTPTVPPQKKNFHPHCIPFLSHFYDKFKSKQQKADEQSKMEAQRDMFLAVHRRRLSSSQMEISPPSKMNGRVNKFYSQVPSALSLTHNISTFSAITLGNGFIKYLFSAFASPFPPRLERRWGRENLCLQFTILKIFSSLLSSLNNHSRESQGRRRHAKEAEKKSSKPTSRPLALSEKCFQFHKKEKSSQHIIIWVLLLAGARFSRDNRGGSKSREERAEIGFCLRAT